MRIKTRKQLDNKIYAMKPQEIVLNIVVPYDLMSELESKGLGYYCDGVGSGWKWNTDKINETPDEYLWRIIAISNTVWLEQEERINDIYKNAFPDFEWYRHKPEPNKE